MHPRIRQRNAEFAKKARFNKISKERESKLKKEQEIKQEQNSSVSAAAYCLIFVLVGAGLTELLFKFL
ncbi:MAG: hypothetical protein MHM6MM_002859 [Cercozoa sp. M6MM]